jgi:hypothetical protein
MPYRFIRDTSIKIPEGIISFEIALLDRDLSEDVDVSEYFRTLSIDELIIGSDDDEDSILYPSRQKIKLYLRDNQYFDSLYWLDIFKTNEGYAKFWKNGSLYFEGQTNLENVKYDLKSRTFSLEFIASLHKLKEIKADNFPPGINDQLVRYDYMIKKILEQVNININSAYFIYPYIIKSGGQNEITAPAHDCYIFSNHYFGSSRQSYFSTHADVLKALVDNFACVGWVEYFNGLASFYMLPRRKPNSAISNEIKIVEYTSVDIVKGYDGIVIHMPNNIKNIIGNVGDNLNNYHYYINCMAGYYPPNGNTHYSNIYIQSNVSGWNAKNPNQQVGWLWELISSEIWSLVGKNRVRLRLKVDGTNYSLKDYISFNNRHFRIKQIRLNYVNSISEIDLIEAV